MPAFSQDELAGALPSPAQEPSAGEFFGSWAERYDREYDARSADGHALRARLSAVLSLVGPGPGQILDAGMGPGRLVSALDNRGWTTYGVDSSGEMVQLARKRRPGSAEHLSKAHIEALPFSDATFDAVVATGALEYSDLKQALCEIARVLRPSGQAVVSYPNPDAYYGIWKTRVYYSAVRLAKRILGRGSLRFPRGADAIQPSAFEALLTQCGFAAVEARVYTSFLPTISPLDALLPALTARVGERLEGRGPKLGRRLATQIVFAARKA